jgi:hypothetical protein
MDLVGLPAEVLVKIIRFVLVYEVPIKICYASCFNNAISDAWSILRVHRRLHGLAMPILYAKNTFEFLSGLCPSSIKRYFSLRSAIQRATTLPESTHNCGASHRMSRMLSLFF